jgi:hypothetical protein
LSFGDYLMARTLAEAEEEYTAVREAYLKALKAESYGTGGVSLNRPSIDRLRKEMEKLAQEVERLTDGGIKVIASTPI